jgi:hypothetical protein
MVYLNKGLTIECSFMQNEMTESSFCLKQFKKIIVIVGQSVIIQILA